MRRIVITALFLMAFPAAAAAQAVGPTAENCDNTIRVGGGDGTYCLRATITREADRSLTAVLEWPAEWARDLSRILQDDGRPAVDAVEALVLFGDRASSGPLPVGDTSAVIKVPADHPLADLDTVFGRVNALAGDGVPLFDRLQVAGVVVPAGTPVPALPLAGLALLGAGLAAAGLRRLNGRR